MTPKVSKWRDIFVQIQLNESLVHAAHGGGTALAFADEGSYRVNSLGLVV